METSRPTAAVLQSRIWRRLVFAALAFIYACSAGQLKEIPSVITLVGSTPGDSLIKAQLGINAQDTIDFIRWKLDLTKVADSGTFSLVINYGEGQPNTLGFKKGGKKTILRGTYFVSNHPFANSQDIYTLKSSSPKVFVSIIKLSDNLFHLLTPEKKLMVGNGGWGYALNRKDPINNSSERLPAPLPPGVTSHGDTVIFSGRTPCIDLAQEYNIPAPTDCLKLKWKLTLYRDPETNLPTHYNLKRTLHRASDIEGKWQMVKGMPSNPDVTLYQLDPDKPDESVFLLVADENVLYFVDKHKRLFVGDHNFSYTLDRMKM